MASLPRIKLDDGLTDAAGRRVITPKYVYDPNGVYGDPNVQHWATYYANGGQSTAGAVHFISVPGITSPDAPETNANTAQQPQIQPSTSSSPTNDPAPRIRFGQDGTGAFDSSKTTKKTSRRKSMGGSVMSGMLEKLDVLRGGKRRKVKELDLTTESAVTTFPILQNELVAPSEYPVATRAAPNPPLAATPRPATWSSIPNSVPSTKAQRSSAASRDSAEVRNSEALLDGVDPFEEETSLSNRSRDRPPAYDLRGPDYSVQWTPDNKGETHLSPPAATSPPEVASRRNALYEIQEESIEAFVEATSHESQTNEEPSLEDALPRQMVYQNMLSVIFTEVLPTLATPSNRNWPLLQQYAKELASLSGISSLVHSRDYRAKLLRMAESVGIAGEEKLIRAIQQDEEAIAEVVQKISTSDDHRRVVLALEGDDAQKFLDVVQDVLDRGFLMGHDDSLKVRRLLVRLCERCNKLPSCLFIRGVENTDSVASFNGGFGDVFRASFQGNVVALKRMRLFHRDHVGASKARKRFCREALLWQQLEHPSIVPFLGIDAETFPSYLCLVSPWMRHGTVLKHLADCGRSKIVKTLFEIIQGLVYLHSKKIIHGDLRGNNILINDKWEACLTDFGLTVFNDATVATCTSRHEGSVRWMAPELHHPSQFGLTRFQLTPESDIYSFACVCLELYTGRPPFHEIQHDPGVMLKVVAGGRPLRPVAPCPFPDEVWNIVEHCWSASPSSRMTTPEVAISFHRLLHPTAPPLQLPSNPTGPWPSADDVSPSSDSPIPTPPPALTVPSARRRPTVNVQVPSNPTRKSPQKVGWVETMVARNKTVNRNDRTGLNRAISLSPNGRPTNSSLSRSQSLMVPPGPRQRVMSDSPATYHAGMLDTDFVLRSGPKWSQFVDSVFDNKSEEPQSPDSDPEIKLAVELSRITADIEQEASAAFDGNFSLPDFTLSDLSKDELEVEEADEDSVRSTPALPSPLQSAIRQTRPHAKIYISTILVVPLCILWYMYIKK